MPRYMQLIYAPSQSDATPEEMAAEMPRWNEYTQSLKDAGLFVAGDQLHRPDAATTVRVREGETKLTDGPFAETKEFLAGYYLLDCPDLDTALAQAARVPAAHYGSIEVRPLVEYDQA
ncbi:MAG TPA: YciI family protein [Solirubrobacteraceae bacterium]